jgi:hypothetical protein
MYVDGASTSEAFSAANAFCRFKDNGRALMDRTGRKDSLVDISSFSSSLSTLALSTTGRWRSTTSTTPQLLGQRWPQPLSKPERSGFIWFAICRDGRGFRTSIFGPFAAAGRHSRRCGRPHRPTLTSHEDFARHLAGAFRALVDRGKHI